MDSSYQDVSTNIHSDLSSNIEKLNNEHLNSKHQEDKSQKQEEASNELKNDAHTTTTGRQYISKAKEPYLQQEDNDIEQEYQQRIYSKVETNKFDVVALEDNNVKDTDPEPLFSQKNVDYKVSVEATEPKQWHEEALPNSNTPNARSLNMDEAQELHGDLASTQFHEEKVPVLESFEQQSSVINKKASENSGEGEPFYDVNVQQETEPSETLHEVVMESQLHAEDNDNRDLYKMEVSNDQMLVDKPPDSGQHILEDEHLPYSKVSHAIGSEIDESGKRMEPKADNTLSSGKADLDNKVNSPIDGDPDDTNLKRLNLPIQDTLGDGAESEVDKRDFGQNIPEEMQSDPVVADKASENANVENDQEQLSKNSETHEKDTGSRSKFIRDNVVEKETGKQDEVRHIDERSKSLEFHEGTGSEFQGRNFEKEETFGDVEKVGKSFAVQGDGGSEPRHSTAKSEQVSPKPDIDEYLFASSTDESDSSHTPETKYSRGEQSSHDENNLKEEASSSEEISSNEDTGTSRASDSRMTNSPTSADEGGKKGKLKT